MQIQQNQEQSHMILEAEASHLEEEVLVHSVEEASAEAEVDKELEYSIKLLDKS